MAMFPCPGRLLARRRGGSSGSGCGTPFFPRILVHLVGLHGRVVQRQRVGRCQGRPLEAVPQLQQVLAVPLQLAGQPRRGLALGDPAEDQEDLGGPSVGLVEGRAGEGVEYPAAGATAVVEDRRAVPPVDLEVVAAPAPRAGEALGMEGLNEFLIAGVLVQELDDREVHELLRCSGPGIP